MNDRLALPDRGGASPCQPAAHRHARWAGPRALVVLTTLFSVLLAACGTRVPLPTRPAWETLPPGSPLRSHTLGEPDAWLRHYVMFGSHSEALHAFDDDSPLAPGDRLLRALQEGVALHESGDYAGSNAVLEWAEIEADRRWTRSLTRELASILVSDRVLAYTPAAAELALIPYYRMLNYLALGEMDGAQVEARKANALLARIDRMGGRCHIEGMLQYVAGLVQRSAGETNDALVSLRLAERALSDCGEVGAAAAPLVAQDLVRTARAAGMPALVDSVVERWGLTPEPVGSPAGGELLVLVEHGFVAHRAQHYLNIPIPGSDLEELDQQDDSGMARLAGAISTELMLGSDGRRRYARRYRSGHSTWADALDGAYILRLAWPAFRLEANRPRQVLLRVGDVETVPVILGNLSLAMREELARERPEMLTRLLLRGLSKYLISREMEEAVEEKHGDAAGFIVGRLANLAGNQMERADTRSWTLLPDRVSLMRLNLPAGAHHVRLEVRGEHGGSRVVDLGEVTVRQGALTVLRERVWANDAEGRWDEVFDDSAPWEEASGDEWEEQEDRTAPAPLASDSASPSG